MAHQFTWSESYQAGRTDGRAFCRTHTAEERAQELEHARFMLEHVKNLQGEAFYTAYVEILENWIDGLGA